MYYTDEYDQARDEYRQSQLVPNGPNGGGRYVVSQSEWVCSSSSSDDDDNNEYDGVGVTVVNRHDPCSSDEELQSVMDPNEVGVRASSTRDPCDSDTSSVASDADDSDTEDSDTEDSDTGTAQEPVTDAAIQQALAQAKEEEEAGNKKTFAWFLLSTAQGKARKTVKVQQFSKFSKWMSHAVRFEQRDDRPCLVFDPTTELDIGHINFSEATTKRYVLYFGESIQGEEATRLFHERVNAADAVSEDHVHHSKLDLKWVAVSFPEFRVNSFKLYLHGSET